MHLSDLEDLVEGLPENLNVSRNYSLLKLEIPKIHNLVF
jgi:hypothetical protein